MSNDITDIYNTTALFKKYKVIHGYNCKDVKNKVERKKILREISPKIVEKLISKRRTGKNLREVQHFLNMIDNRKDLVPVMIGYGFKDTLLKYLDKVKSSVFFPTESLPKSALKLFEKYKDNQIVKIEINREPVNKVLQKVLNIITFGGFEMAKKRLSYDDMFHLYMIVELDIGVKLKIEKNQKINIEEVKSYKMERNDMMISVDRPLTLQSMFKQTIDKVGAYRFYIYSAFQNNCQRFILDILQSNNLGNPEMYKYILQDAGFILQNNSSFLRSISQFSTDTAAKLQELFGLGRKETVKNEGAKQGGNCGDGTCDCVKCQYYKLKNKGIYITYDKSNGNYKYRLNGKSFGTSAKMNKDNNNLIRCLEEVEDKLKMMKG